MRRKACAEGCFYLKGKNRKMLTTGIEKYTITNGTIDIEQTNLFEKRWLTWQLSKSGY